MKKQLLIAAVAATMASVATADISITGGAKVNYTNVDNGDNSSSNTFKHDMDLTVKGNSGDTGVVMVFSNAQTSTNSANATLVVEDVYMTSKIGSVNVKMGQYNNTSDSMISNATGSTRNAGRFTADTTVGGVKITYVDQNDSAEAIILSGEVSGVALSHKMGNAGAGSTNDYTDTKVSGSFGGVDLYYRTKNYDAATSADLDVIKVSGNIGDVAVTYAQAEASTASGTFAMEDVFGEYTGVNNTKGVKASTSVAGNKVAVAMYENAATSTAVSDDYTKFIVTRPLASGATFEATYTDKDAAAGASSDSQTLDLELAVKF